MSLSQSEEQAERAAQWAAELLTPFPASQVEAIRSLVLSDTLAFAREVCGFRFDDLTGDLSMLDEPHGALGRFLTRPEKRKLVLMPRDSYKSSFVTVTWPLQLIARNPNTRILIDSEVRARAKSWAGLIRWTIEANPRFIQLFGHLKREPGWTDEFFTVKRARESQEATVMTSGIDQAVSGVHFPLVIGDDLWTEQTTGTKEQRDKVALHISRLRPVLGAGTLVLVGVRWDDDDQAGRILRAESGGRKMADIMAQLRSQGEAQIGRWLVFFRDCHGRGGESAFKRRLWGLVPKFTPEYLDDAHKDMGEYQFSANYLLDPIPQATATFKKEWVEHFWEPPLPPGLQVTMVVDPAVSDQPRSAYSALTVVGYDPPTRYRFVLYAWQDRVGELELGRKVLEVYEALMGDALHVYAIAVEETALQRVYRTILIAEAERRGILALPLRSLRKEEQRKTKRIRIQALVPLFEQLLFFLRPEHGDLIEGLARYPRGVNLDLVDSLAYHLDLQRNLSALVYPMFDPERHVVHQLPARFDRVAAALNRPAPSEDFGLLVMGRANRAWYAIEEAIIPRGSSNTDILSALYTVRTQYHIPTSKILLPPHEIQLRKELVQMKFPLRLARAFRDPLSLYSRMGTMIERDRFYVADHLEELRREFTLFSWPERSSTLLRKPDLRYARLIGAAQLIIWQEEPPERQYLPAPKDPLDEPEQQQLDLPRRPYPTGYGTVRTR